MVSQNHPTTGARDILRRISGLISGAVYLAAYNLPSLYRYRRWRAYDRGAAHSERCRSSSGEGEISRDIGKLNVDEARIIMANNSLRVPWLLSQMA